MRGSVVGSITCGQPVRFGFYEFVEPAGLGQVLTATRMLVAALTARGQDLLGVKHGVDSLRQAGSRGYSTGAAAALE